MDRVVITRLLLALAFAGAGVLSIHLVNSARNALKHSHSLAVRLMDHVYNILCVWGSVVMVDAVLLSRDALFVRDWLSFVLPVTILWPNVRRYLGLRLLKKEARRG